MTEYEYYVGDPCYVIDRERWDEFCDALWAEEAKSEKAGHGRYNYPFYVPWNDKEVEVWGSPFGDGCWSFDSIVGERGWVSGTSMPVDAGLLAIVPYECVADHLEAERLGILFDQTPCLETGENVDGYVQLEGFMDDATGECYNCGEIVHQDSIEYNNVGTEMCWSCYEDEEE